MSNLPDIAPIERFITLARDRGHPTSVNEPLKRSIQAEDIEVVVRNAICDALRRA